MRVVIFTNGDYKDEAFYREVLKGGDFIICTDGGGNYLRRWGIRPNLIVGDMDSISPEVLEGFKRDGVDVRIFPKDKDYTDTHLAVIEALKLSPSEVLILGGIGTRLDHILGNLHLLFFLFKRSVKARLLNEFYEARVISQGESSFEIWGDKVSILPLTQEVEFEGSEGLRWPLYNLTLRLENPIGISNEPTSPNFKVKVKRGVAFLFQVKEG